MVPKNLNNQMINRKENSKKISKWMTNLLEISRVHQNILNS